METLKKELYNDIHWEETYERMVLKQGFSKEDTELLWKIKEIYKNGIINEITSGNYKWSIPRKVEIAKNSSNKKRVIYMYNTKDRYIIGVLYRATSARFKDKISKNWFSYKKCVGTSSAIKQIKRTTNENLKYGVKVDIHSYFNSVPEFRVRDIINELFDGGIKNTLEKLLFDNRVEYKGDIISEWKSLIPGCAFGSFLANICLDPCDKYFDSLDNEKVVYARYSDDILVLSESKEDLENYLNKIKGILDEYELVINPNKYTWFGPKDNIEYLGLSLLGDGNIDISKHAKQKIKKQIHRWCRKGRVEIERDHKNFDVVAKRIIRQLNNKNFKCFIHHEGTFGWAMYAFPKITIVDSLREIDLYTKDTLRAMKTGKHNKNNIKALRDEDFRELGWVSLVELYYLYKKDFDYYCEIIELM